MVQQGKIPAFRVGARWHFKREKIDEWVENQGGWPKGSIAGWGRAVNVLTIEGQVRG